LIDLILVFFKFLLKFLFKSNYNDHFLLILEDYINDSLDDY